MEKKSWRTTIFGVATIVMALAAVAKAYFDGDPATNPDFEMLVAQISLGIGLIFAKDSVVTGGTVPATLEATERVP